MYGSIVRKIIAGVAIAVCVIVIALIGQIVEFNDASSIMVIQYPTGKVNVYTSAGPQWQWFGKVSKYDKSFQFWFSAKDDQGSEKDDAIRCRFNDGGHANISGSCRITMPMDTAAITMIYENYVTKERLAHELVKPQLQKAVYFSGPLMSSKESAGPKRTLLSEYISDQATKGVFATSTKDTKEADPITGEIKTIMVVQIDRDAKTGQPLIQEVSPFARFKIGLDAMSLNSIDYDQDVEKQISQQQQLTMQIQTAVAQAKTAEQQALTAQKEGEANAAKAKWEQEVVKAKAVVLAEQEKAVTLTNAERDRQAAVIAAEQRLKVAELDRQASEQAKQQAILLGEGKAQAARLEMDANGALVPKLEAWVQAQKAYADALSKYHGNLVPQIVMGGTGSPSGTSSATDFMNMLMMNQAKQLELNMTMQGGNGAPPAPKK